MLEAQLSVSTDVENITHAVVTPEALAAEVMIHEDEFESEAVLHRADGHGAGIDHPGRAAHRERLRLAQFSFSTNQPSWVMARDGRVTAAAVTTWTALRCTSESTDRLKMLRFYSSLKRRVARSQSLK